MNSNLKNYKKCLDPLLSVFILLSDCSSNLYNCTTWTGANATQTEAELVWGNSGAKVNYKNWSPGNPDYGRFKGILKECVDLFNNGQWNDRNCNHTEAFICERNHN